MRHLVPEFEKLKERYPAGFEASLVLPCLRRIQEDRGFVAEEDIVGLVDYLGVPRIQVEEVLSYYTMLRRKPIGRFHLQACRNIACSMRGAEGVVGYLRKRLGIGPGETTPDGRFTLSVVECLGSCGTAPVVMVNEAYHEDMSLEKLDRLVDELAAAGEGK
ncbi:MAG: NADH-quinone oxidoreductase subunit NuoE [Burkholderiales bacterium]